MTHVQREFVQDAGGESDIRELCMTLSGCWEPDGLSMIFTAYKHESDTHEVSPYELKKAVESQRGGTATFIQSVPLREMHKGKLVWEGVVHVFHLTENPKATQAYAWSYALGNGKRRLITVLHAVHVKSPRDAVRAAIAAEQKGGK